jgi:hypothetical protein
LINNKETLADRYSRDHDEDYSNTTQQMA